MNCKFSFSPISQQLSFLTATDFFAVPLYKGGCWQCNPFLQARKICPPKTVMAKFSCSKTPSIFQKKKKKTEREYAPYSSIKISRKTFGKSELKIEDPT